MVLFVTSMMLLMLMVMVMIMVMMLNNDGDDDGDVCSNPNPPRLWPWSCQSSQQTGGSAPLGMGRRLSLIEMASGERVLRQGT